MFEPDGSATAQDVTALQDYAALGDGRSIALAGSDGSIDWWCVPNMDSPPFFDRIVAGQEGARFLLAPAVPFAARRAYRPDSNVLETTFETTGGVARLTESLNSSLAGRLPWGELARRIEVVAGRVAFRIELTIGTRAGAIESHMRTVPNGWQIVAGPVMGALLVSADLDDVTVEGSTLRGSLVLEERERALFGLVVGENEPLALPSTDAIDRRIDISDRAWRAWAESLRFEGPYREAVRRSALALKLLLFSDSGAIAAAATTSLPERIGGNKNWDYRYAWIRDMAFTIDAFMALGLIEESKAAFTWLSHQVQSSGAKVVYTIWGEAVSDVQDLPLPGYRDSQPVVVGNAATKQHQHGIFADLLEVAVLFVDAGHLLDRNTAAALAAVADTCAARWREPDSGIWELEDAQHYTLSKVSAWQALDRAARLAGQGVLPDTQRDCWISERDAIAAWVEKHCWSETRQSYTFYAGTERLDAAMVRAVLVDFGPPARLHATCDAIRRELAHGPLLYRYTGAEKEEGAFLACSFWLIEAYAHLGRLADAEALMAELMPRIDHGANILAEMVDVRTGEYLGNLPQGLSQLGLIKAACGIAKHSR